MVLCSSTSLTSEEIEEVLRLANINSSDVAPVVQTLYTTISLNQKSDYRVLELDDHLIENLKIGDW